MNPTHYITSDVISIEEINQIIYEGKEIALSEEAKLNIEKCRAYIDAKLLNN